MKIYYNEINKKKCSYLEILMRNGFIPKGDIDDRSIKEVMPADVQHYDQCHFFAGLGIWSYALNNLSKFRFEEKVWTGSCPCQSYSPSGARRGASDPRHLWPEWNRLIAVARPSKIFGEQVKDAIAYGWLDEVAFDLEGYDYAIASAVLPACSVGAKIKRDRLWFVADTDGNRPQRRGVDALQDQKQRHQNIEVFSSIPFRTTNREVLSAPPVLFPSDGYSERVGLLHSAGDAIVPEVAATFIDCAGEMFQ